MTAPCVFVERSRPARSLWPRPASSGTWPSPGPRPRRQPARRPGSLLRGLLQLGADPRVRAGRSAARHRRGDRRRADGQPTRCASSTTTCWSRRRARAQRDALAPGPAVLQRRRPQTCSVWMPVDPVPRESTLEFVAGSHLGPWLMPRTFMDDRGEVVPRGHARGAARHRGRPRRLPDRRLGARAGRRRVLQHADAARRRRRRRPPPARFSVRFARRRRHPRAAGLDDVAGLPRAADELPAGAPMDHPLFPVVWERCRPRRRSIGA